MAKQLLSAFGKRGDTSFTTTGIAQGLADIQVDIEDTAHLSNYFHVVEFNPVFTAGKNSISFNGSDFLGDGSEIKVEVLDNDNNSLYLVSPPENAHFVDIANFTVAIHVYKETVSGAGKVILVGTTTRGEIVRWTGNITINTTYPNVSRVRFYNSPSMEITPLLYPVIQSYSGSMLNATFVVTGSCSGGSERAQHYTITSRGTQWSGPSGDYQVIMDNTTAESFSFNSQMIDSTITLYVVSASLPVGNYNAHRLIPQNTTQSFTIKKVTNSTTLVLNGAVVNSQAVNYATPEFVGFFSITYVESIALLQATATPCTALSYAGGLNLHTNTDIFTASMVGQQIQINYGTLYFGPPAYSSTRAVNTARSSSINYQPVISGIYTLTNVSSSRSASIGNIYYSLVSGHDQYLNATASGMSGSITLLNGPNPFQHYTTPQGSSSLMQKSYVNVTYRDIDTFSGMVARHKVYAKSNVYPGDFTIIGDSILGPSELLTDPVTVNQKYASIGVFYTQDQINQYWFSSTPSLNLIHTDMPVLNRMTISPQPTYDSADGNNYVIVKTSAFGLVNDCNYYPYDAAEYNNFTGQGYTSNFIPLLGNVLYALSMKLVVQKDPNVMAKLFFYFTSSSPGISSEITYNPQFGVRIGEIDIPDLVATKYFSDAQKLYFTPQNDYYGTLVIVPYLCSVTLENISLQNYGDHGFSPQVVTAQLPFPLNVANESWTIRAELYDTNANLVYSLAPTVQVFDPTGISLFGSSVLGSAGGSGGIPSTLPLLTIQSGFYLPGIGQCPSTKRLLGFNIPTHYPPLSGEGSVCYTDIIDLELTASNSTTPSLDYLSLSTTAGTGKSIAVRYSGTTPNIYGRRVYVDSSGVKTTYL